ncbi:MAG: alkaline phosphatase [Spirochaetaceae bacterium]|jgi:predicted AlkP superfamily pyrophosphatase or phosphodiesterase|nr:alkaline phosphatase [Spirochaetaceae bacterium]
MKKSAVIFILFLAACTSSKAVGEKPEHITLYEYPVPVPSEEAAARHVVLIGFDGWGAYSLPRADMPTVKRMIAGGASTLKAQSVLPTNSWPNWSALFFGAPPEVHGYREEGPFFESALRDKYGFFPGLFAMAAGERPELSTAFFYEWSRMGHFCPPGAAGLAEHIPDLAADKTAVARIAEYLREARPNLAVIIFDEPDHTGHSKRHGSPAYYEKLKELDSYAALFEQAVRDGGYYEDTVFIFTADHGGFLWGHGFNTPSQRQIPLVIFGKNIKKGFVIPGPVTICDIAPTIAEIFQLAVPPAWTGKALTEVFE